MLACEMNRKRLPGTILVKQKKSKQVWLIILSIALFFGSLHVLTGDFGDSHSGRRAKSAKPVAICGVLFFGLGGIGLSYQLLKRKYIVIMDDRGFEDHSTLANIGFVAWTDVKAMERWVIGKQEFIGIEVWDTDKLLAGKSWYARKLIRANMALGYPPITINLNSAKEEVGEVLAKMRENWSA